LRAIEAKPAGPRGRTLLTGRSTLQRKSAGRNAASVFDEFLRQPPGFFVALVQQWKVSASRINFCS